MRLFLLFCSFFVMTAAHSLDLEIKAESVFLMNAETGAVLYDKEPDKKIYPASLTKIITAFHTLEKSGENLDQVALVSKEALKRLHSSKKKQNNYEDPAYWLEDNVILLWVHAGLRISLQDLLYGTMLKSANDSANALAEAQSETIPAFMGEVNELLQKIGCNSTHFMNPHGIHHPDHYTTARDLALMTTAALKSPEFCKLFLTLSYTPSVKFGPVREWKQVNRLIKPSSKCYYPPAIGGKTGFHLASGYNLVAAAEKNGRRLIGVIIGSATAEKRYMDMIRLFDAAFEEKRVEKVCFSSAQLFTRKVETDKPLRARLQEDISLKYYPAEEPKGVRAYVVWEDLQLPISKGQKVGEVQLFSEEGLLKSSQIYSCDEIEDSFLYRMRRRLKKLFQ